ncbi:MAG: hypothetical protein WEB29_10630 [Chloroflexota bacterium]
MDPEQANGTPKKPYAVGILFVHGMGEQVQGDSVTDMGDALTEWLRKWLAPVEKSVFKIRDATLRSGGQVLGGEPDHPIGGQAHVSVTIGDETKTPPAKQKWRLAESWWATTFRQATFFELVTWAFSAGPWLIASQRAGLENRFRSAAPPNPGLLRRVLNAIAAFFITLVAAIVASAVTPVLLALLIFSLIPIPALTDLVRAIAKNLTGSFGDLLILVRSPVRFAAMAEQVRTDIVEMDRLCDRVIVLAHSQGSAVSWHAIRRNAERDPDKRARIDLFLSFGQAFRKLKSLYLVQTAPGRRKLTFFGLATLTTVLLVVAGYNGAGVLAEVITSKFDLGEIVSHAQTPLAWFGGALLGVLVVQVLLVRMARRNDRAGEEEIQGEIKAVQKAMPGFRWLDLWASADPAPNGQLLDKLPKGVESYKIRNVGSTLLDHAIYWSNRTVFVSAVAFAAAGLAPPSPIGITDGIPPQLREAAKVRGRRVTMLLAGRVLFLVALATTLWGIRNHLPEWGAAILGWVDSLPLPDWFAGWPAVVNGFVAAGLVAIIGLVLWWLTMKGWDIVIGADEAAFFGRRPAVEWSALAIAWMIAAVLLPTAVIVGLAIYLENWSVFLAYLAIAVVAVPVALISLSAGGTTLDEAPQPPEA